MIQFTAFGAPIPKGSTKAFVPKGWTRPIITAANMKTKPWAESVKWAAINSLRSEGIPYASGPVCMYVTFFMPKPKSAPKHAIPMVKKPDIDKLLRTVLDALKGVIWTDDSQVTRVSAAKDYAEDGTMPRAEIRVGRATLGADRAADQLGLRAFGLGA
jgi:crossover junction endodeoxyribonuclease RusA